MCNVGKKKSGFGNRSECNLEFTVTEEIEAFNFLNERFNGIIVPYEDNGPSKRPEHWHNTIINIRF